MTTLDHFHGDLSGLDKVGIESVGEFVDLTLACGHAWCGGKLTRAVICWRRYVSQVYEKREHKGQTLSKATAESALNPTRWEKLTYSAPFAHLACRRA